MFRSLSSFHFYAKVIDKHRDESLPSSPNNYVEAHWQSIAFVLFSYH